MAAAMALYITAYFALTVLNVKYVRKVLQNKGNEHHDAPLIPKTQERILFLLVALILCLTLFFAVLGGMQAAGENGSPTKQIALYGLISLIAPQNINIWLAVYLLWVNRKRT